MKYYDGLKALSYNAIYNFIISNRNFGKTWCFKRRAFRRALKHGRKTLWLRTFEKEVKQATDTMYSSKDLQKFCGIEPYSKENPNGNFKQCGHTFYVKRNGRWVWFLKIAKVGDKNALRSSDDVDLDTIIYDEFTTTPEDEARFRGDRVDKFNDIFFSEKRQHSVTCIFLGNKENPINPFFTYFGLPQLPASFEGIRRYRDGAIIIQQINNAQPERNEYDKKVAKLFAGTKYGGYVYDSEYKGTHGLKTRKIPREASVYVQLNVLGTECRIWLLNGFFYIGQGVDKTDVVYCLDKQNKYKNERLLVKRQKTFFTGFINAIADGRVYYASPEVYTSIQAFYQWLSI